MAPFSSTFCATLMALSAVQTVKAQCPFLASNGVDSLVKYRTPEGDLNNLRHQKWGSNNDDTSPFLSGPRADAVFESPSIPNTRLLSNVVFDQNATDVRTDVRGLSTMVTAWGQYINHDISFVFDLSIARKGLPQVNITVPKDDQYFTPGSQMLFLRVDGSANNTAVNTVSSHIDASIVYGSTPKRTQELRDPQKPWLLASIPGNFMPIGDRALYESGDDRVSQNPLLASMHTLLFREHNYVAELIRKENPNWDPERVFQEARVIIEAELQDITYQEWLPALLGENYREAPYDPSVNGQLMRLFHGSFMRFGHSTVPNFFTLANPANMRPLAGQQGMLPLCNPANATQSTFFGAHGVFTQLGGIDSLVAGMMLQQMEGIDTFVATCLRNHLFRGLPTGEPAMDLVALSVQRARDYNSPSYVKVREVLVGDTITSINQITKDPLLQDRLRQVYGDDVSNIDLYVGMLTEEKIPGSSVGPTLRAGLLLQFSRIQRSDRLWYRPRLMQYVGDAMDRDKFVCQTLNPSASSDWCNSVCNLSPRPSQCDDPSWCSCKVSEVHNIRRSILGPQSTMRNVIRRNTKIRNPRPNPFVAVQNKFTRQRATYGETGGAPSYEPTNVKVPDEW